MSSDDPWSTRRQFLQGSGALTATALAGCSDTSKETETREDHTEDETSENDTSEEPNKTDDKTDEEQDTEDEGVTRPDNYRWDLIPERNQELRDELGQYSEVDVGGLVENHPALEHSTESEIDNHGIDFNALKLYRESNFDLLAENSQNPMEEWVQAFVDENFYAEDKEEGSFQYHDVDSPRSYSAEEWLNANTVEDSLDLGHNPIDTIGRPIEMDEHVAVIREAYQRHHDFDVLAWSIGMDGGAKLSGLMYSPDDDKIRAFEPLPGYGAEGSTESHHMHTEIQDWPILEEGNEHHPLRFHAYNWDSGSIDSFEDAKRWNAVALTNIATDTHWGRRHVRQS